MASKHHGICRLCGIKGPLSFDHVPPEKAFNSQTIWMASMKDAWEYMPGDPRPAGHQQQKGMGGYTLCGPCNSKTGGWYANELVKWCIQADRLMRASNGNPSLIYMYRGRPLRVLKEIVTMFFSINDETMHRRYPDLARFVLEKEQRHLSPRYRFFIYYNVEGRVKQNEFAAKYHWPTRTMQWIGEIALYPFGYVFTVDSPPPREVRLFEISHFARYGYYEPTDVQLQAPVLPTWSPVPGDYPTLQEFTDRVAVNSASDMYG